MADCHGIPSSLRFSNFGPQLHHVHSRSTRSRYLGHLVWPARMVGCVRYTTVAKAGTEAPCRWLLQGGGSSTSATPRIRRTQSSVVFRAALQLNSSPPTIGHWSVLRPRASTRQEVTERALGHSLARALDPLVVGHTPRQRQDACGAPFANRDIRRIDAVCRSPLFSERGVVQASP